MAEDAADPESRKDLRSIEKPVGTGATLTGFCLLYRLQLLVEPLPAHRAEPQYRP
jgi:hypothetical protein